MSNCDMRDGRRIHECGKSRIVTLDNLVQNHPYVVGKIIPVKIEVYPCQEARFEEAGRAGEKSAERFKKMFQRN